MINIISEYPTGKKRLTQLVSQTIKDTETFIEEVENESERVFCEVRLSPQPTEEIQYGVAYTIKGETMRRFRTFDTKEEQYDFIHNIRFTAFDVCAYLIDPND